MFRSWGKMRLDRPMSQIHNSGLDPRYLSNSLCTDAPPPLRKNRGERRLWIAVVNRVPVNICMNYSLCFPSDSWKGVDRPTILSRTLSGVRCKVARYSFSGSIPPKFGLRLYRFTQWFAKIATTVVVDKDENLLWSGLQWHRSCHSNEMSHYLFYFQYYFSALGTVLPKLFTGAFSSNSCLNVCEV